jgi:catechol 2,3-dioxygenase-like lactoylglutathione lyase family enzyme
MRLEHANVCVRDVDATIRFLTRAFPEFRVRHEGLTKQGTRWVHVGTDETYVALQAAFVREEQPFEPYSGLPGLNHLAYVVDDVEAVRRRLAEAGYKDTTPPNAHPYRKRVYFMDPAGNDWEFVEYLTEDRAKRNDYSLPE